MDIILKQQFDLETRNNGELAERFYQDKLLIPSVIFAVKHKKAAVRYSQVFRHINPALYLILVREDNYIQIWYEKGEPVKSKKEKGEKEEVSVKHIPEEVVEAESTAPNDILVDGEFIEICQNLLMEYLGPFSKIIIKKNVAKKPQLLRNELIVSLIEEVMNKPHGEELVKKLEELSS